MPYPARHGYLTILGDSFTSTEEWQTGFHFTGAGTPDESALTAADAAVVDFLNTPALRFPSFARYLGLKHVRLEPDGRYPTGEVATEWFRSTPYPGTNSTGGYPQIALVTSLRTARPRGIGSNGRNYWPSAAEISFGGGWISTADADQIATAGAVLISALNDLGLGSVCVASTIGSGLLQPVTGVRVGRVMDTQRRRRNQLPELYTSTLPLP